MCTDLFRPRRWHGDAFTASSEKLAIDMVRTSESATAQRGNGAESEKECFHTVTRPRAAAAIIIFIIVVRSGEDTVSVYRSSASYTKQ